jgi:hypothetical protein
MVEVLTLVLVVAVLLLLLLNFFKKSSNSTAELQSKILELEKGLQKIETALREDFRLNREESDRIARENRTELTVSLTRTGKEQADKLEALISKIEEKNRELRSDIEKAFKVFADGFDKMLNPSTIYKEKNSLN